MSEGHKMFAQLCNQKCNAVVGVRALKTVRTTGQNKMIKNAKSEISDTPARTVGKTNRSCMNKAG